MKESRARSTDRRAKFFFFFFSLLPPPQRRNQEKRGKKGEKKRRKGRAWYLSRAWLCVRGVVPDAASLLRIRW